MHKIRFPVGDWSNDGHGRASYFYAFSSVSSDKLADIHKSCFEKLGFNIGDICEEYEDSQLAESIVEALTEKGFELVEDVHFSGSDYYMTDDLVFNLWIDILRFLDPTIELEIFDPDKGTETFYAPGGIPGYGVFGS